MAADFPGQKNAEARIDEYDKGTRSRESKTENAVPPRLPETGRQ